MKRCIIYIAIIYVGLLPAHLSSIVIAQPASSEDLSRLVLDFKRDERGPYQAIRWFCPDGSIQLPGEPCSEPGGIQHALHKDIVQRIAREQHIYLGQILAGTPITDFLDGDNQNLRMKQYAIEQYLQRIDDGWIMRRARFYRGALQAEDETAWGMAFLRAMAADDDIVNEQFFLLRQSFKDIPHATESGRWDHIRAEAKAIADTLPSFMPLRIKIHGQPDAGDVDRLQHFLNRNQTSIPGYATERIQQLRDEMQETYARATFAGLSRYAARLSEQNPVLSTLNRIIRESDQPTSSPESRCGAIADLLLLIRTSLPDVSSSEERVTLLDLSQAAEQLLYFEINAWQGHTFRDLIGRQHVLARAAVGCGFLELWEWAALEPQLRPAASEGRLPLARLIQATEYGRQAVQWGAGMVRAEYLAAVTLFQAFEPQAAGFIDDRLRGSILLRLGEAAGELADRTRQSAGLTNQVMDIANQNGMAGLNPGYAKGELVVISGAADTVAFLTDKIYVLEQAPADMKPVAGILTVSSGNLISHVQLLARNLGIPNTAILADHFTSFTRYHGQKVFYAVSPQGTVVMKPVAGMSREENALFDVKTPLMERVRVPTDRIDLQHQTLVSLRDLRAVDSGRICGPKAANLAELKFHFREKVVDGLVITFGLFRRHMNQPMPGYTGSYWAYLRETFDLEKSARRRGMHENDIERMVLGRLARLRDAIKIMPLLDAFTMRLDLRFSTIFNAAIDSLPVFIRSDTNMEDLKDFTGAGLNLTVFNVRGKERIYQAIRDVWASPYTERSYRWRQKVLENPEDVYPSILILPTVDVDKSGVLITTGVGTGDATDLTVAFNRGPGGAVEGQAAETYLLRDTGDDYLLSPSRETRYTLLPRTGGVGKATTRLHRPVLTADERRQLRRIAADIKTIYAPEMGVDGALDIELGFEKGRLWLFQVRPYVENKRAKTSQYLLSLDPVIDGQQLIPLEE